MKNEVIDIFYHSIGIHNFCVVQYCDDDGISKYLLKECGYGIVISDASFETIEKHLSHYNEIFLKEAKDESKELSGIPLSQVLKILE